MKFIKVRKWDYEVDGLHSHSVLTNLEAEKHQVISHIRKQHRVGFHLNVQDSKVVKVKEKSSIIINIPESPL